MIGSRTIAPQELDDALDAKLVKLGRANRREIRCCVLGCAQRRGPGHAWRLFVDGHSRGFICEDCWPPGTLLPKE